MLHESEEASPPSYIESTPSVITVQKKHGEVIVNLTNLTTDSIVISPNSNFWENRY